MSKHEHRLPHPLLSLARVWFDCALEASLLGHSLARGTATAREVRSSRGRWLSNLAEVADRSMRSSGFLELMGVTLHTMSAPTPWAPGRALRVVPPQGKRPGVSR